MERADTVVGLIEQGREGDVAIGAPGRPGLTYGGLRELARVMRRGGAAFVIDIDASRGAFGRWFRASLPSYSPEAVERFWARHGWQRRELDLRMVFSSREDLAAVLRIEFTPDISTNSELQVAKIKFKQ